MTKTILASALATLMFCGTATAAKPIPPAGVPANAMKVESEAQLMRDYGDRIEKVSLGVYQIVSGDMAGKTISIGDQGLAYDLAVHRARIAKAGRITGQDLGRIQRLESAANRIAQGQRATSQISTRLVDNGTLYCHFGGGEPNAAKSLVTGYAWVSARADFLEPIGLGYYAGAVANAYGYVDAPSNPGNQTLIVAETSAVNYQTSQMSLDIRSGMYSASAFSSIASGPTFSHSLSADAAVYGAGPCWGYVSVSDYFAY